MPDAYTVIADSHDRERWLAERDKLVTASDVATLLNLNPYSSPLDLYLTKRGLKEPFTGNEITEWGLLLEPVIIKEFSKRTGREAMPAGQLLRSTRYPFLGCTLDAWQEGEDGRALVLECKTTGAHRADDWEEGVPPYYVPQVQAQMLVTDTPMASVACLIGGQRMVWCDVARDDVMCNDILEAAEGFMLMVAQEIPPPSTDPDALAQLYNEDDGTVVVLDQDAVAIDVELESVKGEVKGHMATRDRLNAELMTMIGNAHKGVLPGGAGAYIFATSKAGKRYLRRVKR